MKLPGKLYSPIAWESLDVMLREKVQRTQELLHASLAYGQPTYEQLSQFFFNSSEKINVRSEIVEVVKRRAKRSLSMTQEIACFGKAMRERVISKGDSVYQAGSNVRQLLFAKQEPPRTIEPIAKRFFRTGRHQESTIFRNCSAPMKGYQKPENFS
ncbi:hypothetical protein [Massilia genomosp. 1]|uniref:Uncharacterized protein n=1 Tax=Massilia genomosp. 1 TaxID=2609280 RepID=A0ABX0N4T8_9BURK|nr:hypothetical protein [Massilia genomosp. 1]NHZ67055.1 hypothetical protein [Massilia genomosp. 1]